MNQLINFNPFKNSLYDKQEERGQDSIFVSIVSYRDARIIDTIDSLLNNALRPENITISVAVSAILNHDIWASELRNIVENKYSGQVRLTVVDSKDIYNIGHLRKISHEEYNKEKFYMCVSSRSEFDPEWDDILIKQFNEMSLAFNSSKFIFTCDPRGWVPHDYTISDYVFYTNHKTKKSYQREEYDGAKIPVCGFSEFVRNDDLPALYMSPSFDEGISLAAESIEGARKTLKFLKKYNFPKFNNRKFTKNEVIANSLGFSSKFIFANAKLFLSCNTAHKDMITEDFYNFYSLLKIIKQDLIPLSIRMTPVYHLYDDTPGIENQVSPITFYENIDIEDIKGHRIVMNEWEDFDKENLEKKQFLTVILSLDWENLEFKIRDNKINHNLIKLINSFVAAYSFSINENSLHWNKRNL